MSRIYIAAAAVEKPRVEVHAARLREIGYEVIAWLGEADGDSPDAWRKHAEATFAVIKGADVFWLLAPKGPPWSGRGAYVEMGLAVASGIEAIYSGKKTPRGVFRLARCFASAPAALRYLYEREHGQSMPLALSERWWTTVVNGTAKTVVAAVP